MKKHSKIILLLAVLLAFNIANAQFVGTGSQTDSTTVKEIKKHAFRLDVKCLKIKVKGSIVEQFGKHYYWFKDKTGRIKVEIEPKYMATFPFDKNTELVIFGEVDYHLIGRTEIEVKKIELADKL